ncbi:Methanesulfonate monooxygenase component reductase [Stutzerimonas xanthomarina]|nr:Methanesulfonate monooxygenase component reductase [Stutzerimonas xanthomarina]
MLIRIEGKNRTHELEAHEGETVLVAALGAGLSVPYECGTGTCGTCRARLVEGAVEDRWPDAPGRRHLKAADEHLLCQCIPQSDCSFMADSWIYRADAAAIRVGVYSGRLRAPALVARDTATFQIDLDRTFPFEAGQFVTVEVPGLPGARAYSMSNYGPGPSGRAIELLIKRKPQGGFSEWLFGHPELRDGAPVIVTGPFGKATFSPNQMTNVVCIAGGSGLAGVLSILARATDEGYFRQFQGHVFFGVRANADAFLLNRLAKAVDTYDGRLKVTVALSDEPPTDSLRDNYPTLSFVQGMVHDAARDGLADIDLQRTIAYVAGPPPLVSAAQRLLLLERKMSAGSIRYDKFM